MDFDLSDDQLALRDGARELLNDLASPARMRAHTASGAAFDAALWRAMADQGWLGIETAVAAGGVGLGAVEVAVLAEELGRHAAPAPFVSNVLALDALATAGDTSWTDRLLSGDAVACVAWDAAQPVPYAPSADVAIVLAVDGVFALELTERYRTALAPDERTWQMTVDFLQRRAASERRRFEREGLRRREEPYRVYTYSGDGGGDVPYRVEFPTPRGAEPFFVETGTTSH